MIEANFQPKLRPSSKLRMWEWLVSTVSLGMSPLAAKRTGTFPDLSMASVFGWSGAGWTEELMVEQGGRKMGRWNVEDRVRISELETQKIADPFFVFTDCGL